MCQKNKNGTVKNEPIRKILSPGGNLGIIQVHRGVIQVHRDVIQVPRDVIHVQLT